MTQNDKLAIHGGPKAKSGPYGAGMRFMDNELKYLTEALEQNTLFGASGQMVARACEMMKAYTGLPFVAACSSGSAAVHLGLIAAGPASGQFNADER